MSDVQRSWLAIPSQRMGRKSWQGVVHLREHGGGMLSRSIESHYCTHRHASRATATACAEKRLTRYAR